MKAFRFKNFDIQQSQNVFRVGTDGVLLGALAQVEQARHILEVGTGTGLISLMLAQRNPTAQFLGIDINEEAVLLTRHNFQHSPFRSRMTNMHLDFKQFVSDHKFDGIVSNPPYFEASDSSKDKIARQTVELNFLQLITRSAELLTEEGIFSVIIPYEAGGSFIDIAQKAGLFVIRKIEIRGMHQSKPKRLILEFSLSEKPLTELDFTIEKSPRQYSDQYLELTKDFHVFKGD
ncbi:MULTISPECIES: tRNA1(Val) (adenine(37)-N6)-methyltransferase [Chryseobacterium]|uniref:tRNA1(Val) (adenine(37)-N6)-methyltransferase n=1 Tax=Chryseobacterium camelliae TaxID=1265445 RepID=A0ABU0TL83_9FLAO|nr:MULTISPECIES: methyltransferase [Chryseobacterium]MDT3408339.1 tRNA1Val (adenine37-N6)-methyltransferase [Pseudacidovorax intermedius]MDQ1097804.1 tRNA1Val (adenine37-N6)-methyltransferase [Chryseobacterium camelliae]MDQ1101736.1 tRNA1Val (adenine37-N6)-methyltransferase [Chryseobacterium sp. SORGH_AS_1048]MDR6085176.1 tRNA1Val (adenine37-N6)-methyltransferase [Chryseobacterium sp. SORGH_AS_0909]MDR6129534.1 tRNA1Val (adenine37-N6)-methyltransferase [Chryseobacterium sp. SORGH_AS_1175]